MKAVLDLVLCANIRPNMLIHGGISGVQYLDCETLYTLFYIQKNAGTMNEMANLACVILPNTTTLSKPEGISIMCIFKCKGYDMIDVPFKVKHPQKTAIGIYMSNSRTWGRCVEMS